MTSAVLAVLLAGCGTPRPASVKGGECRIFEAPGTVILGRGPTDQAWIDDTIESGVAACRWPRPKPRSTP